MEVDTSKPIILTSGDLWLDIDSYACILAYKHLFDLLGVESHAVISGPLNETITQSVKNLDLTYETELNDEPSKYNYILLDISEERFFAKFVIRKNILRVYDHRAGFEEYWEKQIGENAIIEMVGSCSTLVWEEFKKENLEDKIDQNIAKVLAYAILSNTLALKSQNTTNRDRQALKALEALANFKEQWQAKYYDESSLSILNNPKQSLINDTKQIIIQGKDTTISQLELWDSREFVTQNEALILDILKSFGKESYFFTTPSISEGKNYLVTDNNETQTLLEKAFSTKFKGNLATTDKLYLRKEITKILNN